jgi:hypothetical protein
MMKVCERGANGKFKIKAARAKAKSLDVVVALDKAGAFTHINADHDDVQRARIFTREVEQEDAIARPYVVEHETKLIAPKKAATKAKEHPIFYADFETCKKTNDEGPTTAVPFMMCASNVDGSWKKTYVGANCAGEFLNDLPNDALVYYHNLGFDGNFFKQFGFSVMIQKGSKIMNMKCRDSGKTIILRDSYSLLSKPLRDFPSAFPQDRIWKAFSVPFPSCCLHAFPIISALSILSITKADNQSVTKRPVSAMFFNIFP